MNAGEYIKIGGTDQWAYVIGGCEELVLGITEDREVLLDLRCGSDSVQSLGTFDSAPMPPEDGDLQDGFDWDEWSQVVRRKLNEQGIVA